jgi:cellulose synthase/poly-beta-1,6-N-acetylglucosamine synthase-like glycosyltransferase
VIDTVLAAVFWGGVAGTFYAYFGFPLLLKILIALKPGIRSPESRIPTPGTSPTVTVIIPAHNEERHIEARIRNVLESSYPRERLDVLVVSDASTDRTDEIAAGFEAAGVRLIVQETRKGKTAGLNRAMAVARGEIVVFTDANAAFPPEAIGALVGRLADSRVGLVTGYTRYTADALGGVSEVTNLYTRLERQIKLAESRWGCCVGADGAIFAMRRALYRTLRDDDINDFVLPLGVVERGLWCVFAADAYCIERPGKDLETEFRRQSRITNRTLRAIWRNRHLLNPLRFPVFSFFLWSHKVMRFIVPLLLAASGIAVASLMNRNGFYVWFAPAALCLVLTIVGMRKPELIPSVMGFRPVVQVLSAFVVTNLAVSHGWWRFVAGRSETTWQHDRTLLRPPSP